MYYVHVNVFMHGIAAIILKLTKYTNYAYATKTSTS